MIDHFHPNFPPNLSITPNVGPSKNRVSLGGDDEDAFGVGSQQEAISRYGIAGRVWEAAYAMSTYVNTVDNDLLDFDPPFVSDPWHEPLGVIELGSGTGVVAANIAREIQHTPGSKGFVIATDLPDVCPLLERNLGTKLESSTRNGANSDVVFVRPLSWGNIDHAIAIASEFGFDRASHRLTHIICSDLVYFPELLGPLLRTLIHLTSPPCVSPSGLPVKIVISYKIRSLSKETPFWTAFGLWFSFQPVLARRRVRPSEGRDAGPESHAQRPWRQLGEDEDVDRTFVFVAHRRPESIVWHVPENDQDLMDGVGARETRTKKGDDTFETVLFMGMGIDDTTE